MVYIIYSLNILYNKEDVQMNLYNNIIKSKLNKHMKGMEK